MRFRLLIAILLALLLVSGCGKRVSQKPARHNEETAALPSRPPSAPALATENPTKTPDKAPPNEDEPNWLKPDPRPESNPGPGGNGKVPGAIVPPDGGWHPPNPSLPPKPQPQPQPPAVDPPKPPGPGRLDPQPQPAQPPAKRPAVEPTELPVVTEADMKEVWIFIENASLASGKMPPPVLTYSALVEAKSPAAPLVKAGSIYLTGSPQRESIWAFDFRALSRGDPVLVATQNGVETLSVEQLKVRLSGR